MLRDSPIQGRADSRGGRRSAASQSSCNGPGFHRLKRSLSDSFRRSMPWESAIVQTWPRILVVGVIVQIRELPV